MSANDACERVAMENAMKRIRISITALYVLLPVLGAPTALARIHM